MMKYIKMKLKLFVVIFCLLFIDNAYAQYEKWPNSVHGLQMPATDGTGSNLYQSLMPLLMGGNSGGVKGLAEQALREGLQGSNAQFEVGELCLNHTEIFLNALIEGETWALKIDDSLTKTRRSSDRRTALKDMTQHGVISIHSKVLDAMGKPSSGLMDGSLKWLGSYDECFAVEAKVNVSGEVTSPFTGRYCSADFSLGQLQKGIISGQETKLTIGICMPNSCSKKDTTALLNTILSILPVSTTGLPEPQVTLHSETLELDTKAIIVIAVCSLFGLVMTIATAYDVIVINWLKPKTNVAPQFKTVSEKYRQIDDTVKIQKYGATEHVTSFDNNGDVAVSEKNGIPSSYDTVKVDLEQTQKQEVFRPGKLGQILLSFSIYTNGGKILNTNQSSGTLTAVNGIRFVSMTWVIFCHSIGSSFGAARIKALDPVVQSIVSLTSSLRGQLDNMAPFAFKVMKQFTFQAIENAYVSVDTFFTLSGLLVSYLCLKEMKKRDGALKFNWAMFYFHRFWRLTPPYMLFLMFYVCLARYFSDGPLWSEVGLEPDYCKDTWWKNLVYVNNLVDTKHQCMGWSWYLANDMQFFVLSPLMLVPLYYSPLFGTLSCVAFMLINFISVGILTTRSQINAMIIAATVQGKAEAVREIYIKPWCRVGPYAVGFLTGYILYRTDCKLKIPKIVNLIGWTLAIGVGFAIVYGLYDSTGFPELDVHISSLYHATHRTAWGAAVCWVIVACATGNGGFINTLLSWKAIVPLSRLTYCAYLVHPIVHFVYFSSKRSLVYLTHLEESYMFIGNVVVSYAVAFITSLAFEAPMMGLEKVVLGRGKNS